MAKQTSQQTCIHSLDDLKVSFKIECKWWLTPSLWLIGIFLKIRRKEPSDELINKLVEKGTVISITRPEVIGK